MLFIKSIYHLYYNIKENKLLILLLFLLFEILSLLNTYSSIQNQNLSFELLNVFLSFRSEGFVSFSYLPFCLILTTILIHKQDNTFLVVRFKTMYHYFTFKTIQLIILSALYVFTETCIYFINISVFKIYTHTSFELNNYSAYLYIFYYTMILFVNVLNILILQSVLNIIFKNNLLSFVCIILMVLFDQFIYIKLKISFILYHGIVIQKIDILTLNTIINQCTYSLGILCIVLVGFHHVYNKKEFH